MYWGRCLDDFANLFTQRSLTEQGFRVSLGNIAIKPKAAAKTRSQAKTNEPVTISHDLHGVKVVGEQPELAGTYLRTMFQTIDASAFWVDHQFLMRSDFSYRGDRPEIPKNKGAW